jgi:NADH-quinone oxidoreductase subunit J
MIIYAFSISCFFLIIYELSMLLVTNPITAVFFLLLVFFFSAIIFIFVNGDFIGLIILIIYVGAIVVLFLFIVMMLNLKRFKSNTYMYFIIFYTILFIFYLMYILLSINSVLYISNIDNLLLFNFIDINCFDIQNKYYILKHIGTFIFIDNTFFIIIISMLLLVSIISSIYVTNFKSSFSLRTVNTSSTVTNVYLVYIY